MQCVFMSLYDSKSQTAILMDVYVTTVMWHVCGGEQQVGPAVVVLATPGTGALLGLKAPTSLPQRALCESRLSFIL